MGRRAGGERSAVFPAGRSEELAEQLARGALGPESRQVTP